MMREQGKCLDKKPSCHHRRSPQATKHSLHSISFSDRCSNFKKTLKKNVAIPSDNAEKRTKKTNTINDIPDLATDGPALYPEVTMANHDIGLQGLQVLHDWTIVKLIDSNARLLEEAGTLKGRLASDQDKNTRLRRHFLMHIIEDMNYQRFLPFVTEEDFLEAANRIPFKQENRAVVDMPKPETLVFGLDGQVCFEIMGDRTICNLEEENSKLRDENRRYLEEAGVIRDENRRISNSLSGIAGLLCFGIMVHIEGVTRSIPSFVIELLIQGVARMQHPDDDDDEARLLRV
jgi:hypothetical protein